MFETNRWYDGSSDFARVLAMVSFALFALRSERVQNAHEAEKKFMSNLLFYHKDSATKPKRGSYLNPDPAHMDEIEHSDKPVKSVSFSSFGQFVARVQENSVILEEMHANANR